MYIIIGKKGLYIFIPPDLMHKLIKYHDKMSENNSEDIKLPFRPFFDIRVCIGKKV